MYVPASLVDVFSHYFLVLFVTRGSAILGDIIVLIVTWTHTVKQVLLARSSGLHMNISSRLLYDGTFISH